MWGRRCEGLKNGALKEEEAWEKMGRKCVWGWVVGGWARAWWQGQVLPQMGGAGAGRGPPLWRCPGISVPLRMLCSLQVLVYRRCAAQSSTDVGTAAVLGGDLTAECLSRPPARPPARPQDWKLLTSGTNYAVWEAIF